MNDTAALEQQLAGTGFAEALNHLLRLHRDTATSLHQKIVRPEEKFDRSTIATWRRGTRTPRTLDSFQMLRRVEDHYGLRRNFLRDRLPCPGRSPCGHQLEGVPKSETRRLAWHLPDDFASRPASEQAEILAWVRRVVISGTTEYRRFQAEAMRTRYSLKLGKDDRTPVAQEMQELVQFKTATLTAAGFRRSGVWGEETAAQRIEHLGLMFGAMAARPDSRTTGLGISIHQLGFAMLVFPAVWDWYIQWREQRRGFYTNWEVDMLRLSLALTRPETGWLRQNPRLADRLQPVPGLISNDDITLARSDWDVACDTYYRHGAARIKEVQRVKRIHRDPFEPILPVLEAASPVAEYRRITDEILKYMPDASRYPVAAAESVRSFLLLRLGLHLGLRQKNLRQLLVCPRGQTPRTERQLVEAKRGELRWSEREQGWEVFIPAVAFKNASSSYFGSKPFRLILPDLGDLYVWLEAYIDRHRWVLLKRARDPGTFFVKTVKSTSTDAAYNQTTFYDAWRLTIQRYGIYNPYTGRGAIRGLLPHGPHNIRDVLATHILKQTGSYEQASYAIQDTPAMVAEHYGRFLPQDKAALAARILNEVWGDRQFGT